MGQPQQLSSRARGLRRAVIVGLVLVVAVTVAALIVRAQSDSTLAPVRVSDAAIRGTAVAHYVLPSRAADRRLVQTVVLPAAQVRGRPLLVLLHGKAQDPAVLAGKPLRAALAAQGDRAPVVLLPADDGGSYWHDRRSGRWAQYVMDEAIPRAIRRFRLDPSRVAIGGISMGGAGAFALAAATPGRFCAVGGHSPALWPSAAATAPGAYDDADDFRRNDPVARADAATPRYGVPLWLDVGRTDPFAPQTARFALALRQRGEHLTRHVWAGSHENRYWQRHMPAYMAFYADALARCRPHQRRP